MRSEVILQPFKSSASSSDSDEADEIEYVKVKKNKNKKVIQEEKQPQPQQNNNNSYSNLLYESSIDNLKNRMMNERAKSLIMSVMPNYG